MKDIVNANKNRNGYAYTHKPLTKTNQKIIKFANENGFTINLSANNLKQADEYKNLNVGPVVVILPHDFKGTKGETPKGNRFIVCPAQTQDRMTCEKCKLCQKNRGIIVGFKAHGIHKHQVTRISNSYETI